MAVIAERLHQTPALDWDQFAARHADLFARQPSILAAYYSDATLRSDRARQIFVLPDADARSSADPAPLRR